MSLEGVEMIDFSVFKDFSHFKFALLRLVPTFKA